MFTVSFLVPYFSIILVLSFSLYTSLSLSLFFFLLPPPFRLHPACLRCLEIFFLRPCLDFHIFLVRFSIKNLCAIPIPYLWYMFPLSYRFFERSTNDDSGGIIFLIILYYPLEPQSPVLSYSAFSACVFPLGKKRRPLFEVLWHFLCGRFRGGGVFLAVRETAY